MAKDELVVAISQVLEMEDDVMAAIECEAILHSSSQCGDGVEVCQNCLTQNRLSERMGYLRGLLTKLKA